MPKGLHRKWQAVIGVLGPVSLVVLHGGCEGTGGPEVNMRRGAITAYCTAMVNGVGERDVETDYLPHVVQCENGSAPLEALKAQAVSARTFLYYKLNTSGSINDGTSDQVYSCGRTPTLLHHQAVQETAGQVLRYSNATICAFYVAGAIPTATGCVATASSNDPTNTERYVTYNWGLSGNDIHQTTLGWVNTGNVYNRGCKSQNGATCLANQGWVFSDILKFYYGMDIELHQATGSCVTPTECVSGQTETRSCDLCGTETRTCQAGGAWGAWGDCAGQGECVPGAEETEPCGECGLMIRICEESCSWGNYGACQSVATEDPCDTGLLGACALGRRRCEETQLVCEPVTSPSLERCDDVDNDCNGEVDDGLPHLLGDPPPVFAAELVIASAPGKLQAGESAPVTLWVANRGSATWAPSELLLQAIGDDEGSPSRLYTPGDWLSEELVVSLDKEVPPGGEAQITFSVTWPPGTTEPIRETFWLITDTGEPLRCPAPAVILEVSPDGTVSTSRPDAGPGVDHGDVVRSGCVCQKSQCSREGTDPMPLALLLGLLWGRILSRRRQGPNR